MTIDQIREPDDAELDAFLRGEGGLSPRLKQLSQPSPPPEVTAAVMAGIESALMEEKNAANDGHSRRQARWAMPVAFAASVLVGVMIHMQWRAVHDRGEATVAQASPEVPLRTSAARNESAASGVSLAEPSDSQPSSKPAKVETTDKSAHIASVPAAQPKAAPPIRVATAETQTVITTGIRPSLQQSLNVKRRASTNVEVVTAEDVGKMPDKNVADTLQRLPGVSIAAANKENATPLEQKRDAVNDIDVFVNDGSPVPYGGAPESRANTAATAPAPVAPVPPMSAKEEAAKARIWLDRIERKIELGEDHDALEEWTRFRKTYPDFTVPEAFARKIKALQQK